MKTHLTMEYARLGVNVTDNLGLTRPVAVNAVTGVMHAICCHDGTFGLACLCPDLMQPPDCSQRHRKYSEAERKARFCSSMVDEQYAVIRSLSAVGFRACRTCEKLVKGVHGIDGP